MIKDNQKLFNMILRFLDGKNIVLASLLAWIIKSYTDSAFVGTAVNSWKHYFFMGTAMVPCIVAAYKTNGLYEPMRGQRFWFEAVKLIQAHIVCFCLLIILLFALKITDISRTGLGLFFVFSVLLAIIERYFIRRILRYVRKHGFNQKHILVVGTGDLAQTFAQRVKSHREFGLNIIGFIGENRDRLKVLGNINCLEQILSMRIVDEVIVAIPLEDYQKLTAIIQICEKCGIKTFIIPDYLHYIPARPQILEFEDIPLINIREVPLDTLNNKIIKRAMDMFLSLVFIVLTAPVMLIIAIAIKVTAPGPIIFTQERLGLGGKPFKIYKFRSMHVMQDNSANTLWTTQNDPRRTTFGEFIRKTSLDELPQFFNVLMGDMSLIGPRPERPHFVNIFKEKIPKYMVKHQVKPGITGWAQVNGWRGDTSISERINCDLYYIENWSVWLDIKIIGLTLFKGLNNKNAY